MDPKINPYKSKVYALYNSNSIIPRGVIAIEPDKGFAHIGLEEPILVRFFDAIKILYHLIFNKGFSVVSHTMQEKNEQEIKDWYEGRGLR